MGTSGGGGAALTAFQAQLAVDFSHAADGTTGTILSGTFTPTGSVVVVSVAIYGTAGNVNNLPTINAVINGVTYKLNGGQPAGNQGLLGVRTFSIAGLPKTPINWSLTVAMPGGGTNFVRAATQPEIATIVVVGAQ